MNVHFNLFYNNVRQDPKNTKYPHRSEIRCKEDLAKVMSFDHVCAEYKDNYRKKDNFICADCCMFDVDNSESDSEKDWITPEDVQKAFSDVPFYVSYSRNHLKVKDGKKARPKFHIYFPVDKITNCDEYDRLKQKVCKYFPKFDPNAKDCARFFYGVERPDVRFISGNTLLTDFMKNAVISKDPAVSADTDIIPQGQRNTHMHRFALRVLTRYGDSGSTAYRAFINESQRCSPPLEDKELSDIWQSAYRYYNTEIKTSSEYKYPEKYKVGSWVIPPKNAQAVQQLYNIKKSNRKFGILTAKLFLQAAGITVKLNEMNRNIEIYGMPEKYDKENLQNILPTIIADIANSMSFSRATISNSERFLDVIANENHYHPVKQLLESKQWDGKDRLEDIYYILGITDGFYKTIFRKWALQTVAVLYNNERDPVSIEGVLVLQGAQGIGKTQFFSHLAISERFFKSGCTIDTSDKDSLMSATKVWICELGEIDSTTKKNQSALKSFITNTTDRFREPYARREIARLRKTSFCGTVNPKCYLTDETGNRRFWTIPIRKINTAKIFEHNSEWYTQFWRQILEEYKQNPKGYLLTNDERERINQCNEDYETALFGEDEFLTAFNFEADISNWTWLTAAQIADTLNDTFNSLHIDSVRIGKLLNRIEKRLGINFERKTVRGRKLILCPPHS